VGAGDAFTSGLLDALARRGLLAPASLAELGDLSTLAGVLDDAALIAGITVSRAGADPPLAAEAAALRRSGDLRRPDGLRRSDGLGQSGGLG
jgi:fructokinase